MSSFTSSFSFAKMFAVFALFFGLYSLFIALFQPVVTAAGAENQAKANRISAQDYLYQPRIPNVVIVGTSMSARLPDSALPHDVTNLAFNGGGPLTGLTLVERKGDAPEQVLIESNLIFRDKDEALVSQVHAPVLWRVKGFVPALQVKHQPVNVFLHYMRTWFGESEEERLAESVADEDLAARLAVEQAEYGEPVLEQTVATKLADLSRLIAWLEARGSRVRFFTMPVHPSLVESERYTSTRTLLETHFPDVAFLPEPRGDYRTTDGVHLLYPSAVAYAEVLAQLAEE